MSIAFLKDMQAGSQGRKETQRDAIQHQSLLLSKNRTAYILKRSDLKRFVRALCSFGNVHVG